MKKTNYENGKQRPEYHDVRRGYQSEYKAYYSNGNVSERDTYSMGELEGVVKKYNEDGSLSSCENFVIGSHQGKAELLLKVTKSIEFKFNGGRNYE